MNRVESELSDIQNFAINSYYTYTAKQRDSQTQKWTKINEPFKLEGHSKEVFNFLGYYELGPKLKI